MSKKVGLEIEIDPTNAEKGINKLDKILQAFSAQAQKLFGAMGKSWTKSFDEMHYQALRVVEGVMKVWGKFSTFFKGVADKAKIAWWGLVKKIGDGAKAVGRFLLSMPKYILKGMVYPFKKAFQAIKFGWRGIVDGFKEGSKRILVHLASAFAGIAAGTKLRDTQIEMDKFHAIMELIAKDSTEMEKAWNSLMNTGKAYGTVIQTNLQDFNKFSAVLVRSGVALSEVSKMFSQLSQVSAVYHLDANDTNLAILALTQMVSKGKVSMEELRRQLSERLPGAMQVAAKAFGMTAGELGKMVEDGFVDPVELIRGLLHQFAHDTQKAAAVASTSLLAEMGRLKNAALELRVVMVEGGLGDAMKHVTRWMSDFIDAIARSDAIVEFSKHVGNLAAKLTATIAIDPDNFIAAIQAMAKFVVEAVKTTILAIETLILKLTLLSRAKFDYNWWDMKLENKMEMTDENKDLKARYEASYKALGEASAGAFYTAFKDSVDKMMSVAPVGANAYRRTNYFNQRGNKLMDQFVDGSPEGNYKDAGAWAHGNELLTFRAQAQDEITMGAQKMAGLISAPRGVDEKARNVMAQKIKLLQQDLDGIGKSMNALDAFNKKWGINTSDYGKTADALKGDGTGAGDKGKKFKFDLVEENKMLAVLSRQEKKYKTRKMNMEDETRQYARQAEGIGLTGYALREFNAETDKQNEILRIKRELMREEISPLQAADLTKLAEAQRAANLEFENMNALYEEAARLSQEWRDMWGSSASEFADMLLNMETSFSKFIESLINDILKLALKQKLIEPILNLAFPMTSTSALGRGNNPVSTDVGSQLFGAGGSYGVNVNAKGNAFSGGISAFANGGIVGSPTLFKFASGTGLMGEAGAEGILPLKRGADGKLGVISQGGGGGAVVVNNINVATPEGYTADIEEQDNGGGGMNTQIIIRQIESNLADRVSRQQGPLFKSLHQGGMPGENR